MSAANLIGSYNYALVALSVLIAMFASYAALDLAGRVTAASGWTRAAWLLGGAGAMGTGIWSMHYIGMLAFVLPIPVAYHWPTVLLSLFAAILASAVALGVVSGQRMSRFRGLTGSILMGAGIASMHYIGMAAMRLPAECQFNSFLIVLSVAFAILISLAALWITFHFRNEKTGIGWEKLGGAVMMGAAIPVMHYTGMAAASFTPSGMPVDLSHAVSISALGTAGITAATFIVLGLALMTSWVDRRYAAQTLVAQEEKLQQSEAYLSEAQRLSHTGSWAWKPATGEITYMSEECCRVLGIDPRVGQRQYEMFFPSMHPDDRARVREAVETARREKAEFQLDHRIIHPGGEIRDIQVVGHPVLSPSGDLVEFVGTVIDITERKRAEESLRRSEGYLAEAQKLSHTGSWASRPDAGEILYFSEECYRVLGFNPLDGQPSYQRFDQGVHPDDQPKLREAVETAGRENSEFELDYRFVRPDGEVRDVHALGHPVRSSSGDNIVEFVGTIMDVTESKRAEVERESTQNELRHSKAFLEAAQRIGHVGSWRHDFTSGIVEVSAETRRIWQIDDDEQSSVIEFFFGRVHPDDRPFIEALYGSACALKTEFNAEFRIVLPDGSVRNIHSIGQPTPNRSGEIVELVGSVIDITERKGAEEALRQAQAELARVNRVNTMGELTASLAHEVNQPIAAAVTSANACARWLAGDTPNLEKAQAAAARIVKDGTQAAEIISRIRRLFKKSTVERELVNVNEVIREMIALLRGEATRYNVSVWTDLAPDVPDVMGDRVQLQQVMMNLIMNSIDALNDVDGAREIIIKSQRAENAQILVSVSDTGAGLPPQHADKIFSAFFTTKAEGTGMGLRISRSIIESHDGQLWAADNSPRGAIFNFTLPFNVETDE
jgi:PAS domain S-box-containing protein